MAGIGLVAVPSAPLWLLCPDAPALWSTAAIEVAMFTTGNHHHDSHLLYRAIPTENSRFQTPLNLQKIFRSYPNHTILAHVPSLFFPPLHSAPPGTRRPTIHTSSLLISHGCHGDLHLRLRIWFKLSCAFSNVVSR